MRNMEPVKKTQETVKSFKVPESILGQHDTIIKPDSCTNTAELTTVNNFQFLHVKPTLMKKKQ